MAECEHTLCVSDLAANEALDYMLSWAGLPMEITGMAYSPAVGLRARVEGPRKAVQSQVDSLKRALHGRNRALGRRCLA